MKIENFNWDELYKKADIMMKNIKAKDYIVATNIRSLKGNEPIVEVSFPKRSNTATILQLDRNCNCIRQKGYKKDNKIFATYSIYANRLNL